MFGSIRHSVELYIITLLP